MRAFRLVCLLAAVACARRAARPPTLAPEALLERARARFHSGDFGRALQDFRRLLFELPPSDPGIPEVHYLLAESLFETGQFVEAAHEFRQTADQFAGSPYAPVALLRAGDANMRLWHRPELDPSYGHAALAIYQELAGRYPDSDAAARARLHVRQLREQFAEKAYKTGMFYFKRRAYDSGMIYFKDIVASYPDTPRAVDALLRLADSYRAFGYHEELQETCAHVRRFYPQARGLERSCPPDAGAH